MAVRWRTRLGLLATAILFSAGVRAQSFSGRLTSSVYVFERADSTDTRTTHARGFQAFQLSSVTGSVGLHAYGQVDGDFAARLAGDPKARMYNLYAEWKSAGRATSIRVGRQPIFAGAGNGTLDGLRASVRVIARVRVLGFAGSLLPRDQRLGLAGDLAHHYMAGGQIVVTPAADARLSLAWFAKRQLRPSYTTLRADSLGNLFARRIRSSDRTENVGSLDASWTIRGRTDLYGRGDWDFLGERLTRGELSVRAGVAPAVTASGTYTYRAPRLPANSIFSVFEAAANHEVEGSVHWRFRPWLALRGEAAGILYSGDEAFRGSLGLETSRGALCWLHRGGYAGALDGIDASVRVPLQDGRVTPALQLSWASYRAGDGGGDRETALAQVSRLTVRARRDVTIDTEMQVLRNRYYAHDSRFLVRLQYAFLQRFGGKP